MESLVSVIVPVYNVNKYISRCVESIINQSYNNLEIILVDDGSPDNCPQICDNYAKKDKRVKVIHKKNGGLSDARNAGMNIATGEYISFIDSDDWIDPDMIKILYNNMIENNCDVSSCGVKMVWDDGRPSKMLRELDRTYVIETAEEAMSYLVDGHIIVQTVWNKLYKRELIKDIQFPVGKLNEDEYWSWQAISVSKRTVSVNTPLYFYFQRSGSIMQGGNKLDPYAIIEARMQRQNYINNNLPNLIGKNSINLIYTCLYEAQRAKILLKKEEYRICYKKIKKVVKKTTISKNYLKDLNFCKRMRIMSICKFFGLTCVLQNLLGIGNKSNI